MSIERRQQTKSGPILWRARYRGPDGKERSKTFTRRTDAEKWYAAQTVDMATGGWSDPAKGRVTVRVWSERWLCARSLSLAIDDRWRVLVLFAAFTGLRAGELGALRVGRVDLFRRRVHVVASVAEVHGALVTGPTKTYANRSVALPLFLRDLLGDHIADRADDPDAFVFRSPTAGSSGMPRGGGATSTLR